MSVQLIQALHEVNEYKKHILEIHEKIVQTIRDGDLTRLYDIKVPEGFTQPDLPKEGYETTKKNKKMA